MKLDQGLEVDLARHVFLLLGDQILLRCSVQVGDIGLVVLLVMELYMMRRITSVIQPIIVACSNHLPP